MPGTAHRTNRPKRVQVLSSYRLYVLERMKDTLPSEVAATVNAAPQLETLLDARRHRWGEYCEQLFRRTYQSYRQLPVFSIPSAAKGRVGSSVITFARLVH